MNNEQLRAEFEAWAASIGFCVTGKYAETIDVMCAESAFKAGYKAALQSQDREDESCKWHNYPETDNVWDTDCGQSFEIYEGTPTENGMGFCCYCGKPIREAIDDGDALRLAVKLGIDEIFTVAIVGGRGYVAACDANLELSGAEEKILEDPYAATRRAIVRAAAEIGKDME